jgi:hypothetical protein
VGAAIIGGCLALGVATAGIGGAVCAGAAIGAVLGASFCDDQRTALSCASTGAIAGGVAGLTGGLAAGAGAGAFTVGAVSGLTGDATEQLLATGTINPQRLAAATLTGGALGWAGGRLLGRLTSRSGEAVSPGSVSSLSVSRPAVLTSTSAPEIRPLTSAADDLSGYATVHLDRPNAHASISVTYKGNTIHSEQLGEVGTDAVGSFFRGNLSDTTIPVHFRLPNARRAQAFQRATEGFVFGPYDLETRSCVTYCLDVLEAGGVEDIPPGSVGWRESTIWIWRHDS